MENIKLLTPSQLTKITNHRSGEIKFGEKIEIVPENTDTLNYIQNSTAKFVLLGLPEDIGVKANFGRAGTASAYENALKSLVNIQHNKFCKGSDLLILGSLDFENEMKEAQNLSVQNKEDKKRLFQLVKK